MCVHFETSPDSLCIITLSWHFFPLTLAFFYSVTINSVIPSLLVSSSSCGVLEKILVRGFCKKGLCESESEFLVVVTIVRNLSISLKDFWRWLKKKSLQFLWRPMSNIRILRLVSDKEAHVCHLHIIPVGEVKIGFNRVSFSSMRRADFQS